MRLAKIGALTIAAAFWTTVAVADQGHGHAAAPTRVTTSGAPKTQTHTTSHRPTTTPAATTTTTSHGPTPHGSSPKSTTTHGASQKPTTTHGSSPKSTSTTTHRETAEHETESAELEHSTTHGKTPRTTTNGTTTGSLTTGGTTASGTTTGGPTTSPIATKIKAHPQLAAKVTAMLPAGMTMDQAASGFRNQGQFLAALNASRRTNIPFADLKAAMVTNHQSLGQAVHTLSPAPKTGGTTTGGTTTTTTTVKPKHGHDH